MGTGKIAVVIGASQGVGLAVRTPLRCHLYTMPQPSAFTCVRAFHKYCYAPQMCKKLVAEGFTVVGTVRSESSRNDVEDTGASTIAGAH